MLIRSCEDCRDGPIFNPDHFPDAACTEQIERHGQDLRLHLPWACAAWRPGINDPTPRTQQ